MFLLTSDTLLSSALGGSHGVPKVHYKGRQGDYYVMVCQQLHLFVVYGFHFSNLFPSSLNFKLSCLGHGHVRAELVGCMEFFRAGVSFLNLYLYVALLVTYVLACVLHYLSLILEVKW